MLAQGSVTHKLKQEALKNSSERLIFYLLWTRYRTERRCGFPGAIRTLTRRDAQLGPFQGKSAYKITTNEQTIDVFVGLLYAAISFEIIFSTVAEMMRTCRVAFLLRFFP